MGSFEEYVLKNGEYLKRGYTTGTCAAAAATAAVDMLLSDQYIYTVKIKTPIGIVIHLDIENIMFEEEYVSCAVKKYSGDDPDITNGIYIFAKVKKIEKGIVVEGGRGIGVVTKQGLSVDVGNAAINPVPMKMITENVQKIVDKYGYKNGIWIEISIPDGERLAKQTYNPRLGIVGGISVLGTTGIVEPMSNKAIIDTIKLELDIKLSEGISSLLVVPGNYGKTFAKDMYGIDFSKAVMCSNFIGDTLDYISGMGFKNIIIMGHAGKLIKIAGGIMNTHSSVADCRMEIFAAHYSLVCDADRDIVNEIMNSATVDAANSAVNDAEIINKIWDSIGDKIVYHITNRLRSKIGLYIIVFGKNGVLYQNCDNSVISEVFKNER